MNEPINERVEVLAHFTRVGPKAMPVRVKWNGRLYKVEKLGYYHRFRRGREMIHSFSVIAEAMYLKLELNADTMVWHLMEIYDAESPA